MVSCYQYCRMSIHSTKPYHFHLTSKKKKKPEIPQLGGSKEEKSRGPNTVWRGRLPQHRGGQEEHVDCVGVHEDVAQQFVSTCSSTREKNGNIFPPLEVASLMASMTPRNCHSTLWREPTDGVRSSPSGGIAEHSLHMPVGCIRALLSLKNIREITVITKNGSAVCC